MTSLLAFGLLDAAQLSVSLGFVAGALTGIAPFLLLAVALAAFPSTSGAALAFVTAGAVSCIPAAIAVWAPGPAQRVRPLPRPGPRRRDALRGRLPDERPAGLKMSRHCFRPAGGRERPAGESRPTGGKG